MFTWEMAYPMRFPKPESRAAEKAQKQRAKLFNRRSVWRFVKERDHHRCRNCSSTRGLHHHHIQFLSRGGNDSSENVVLLCAECHADIHAYRLHIVGMDANKQLKFVRTR